jgi:hypothetical protein
MSVNVKVVRVNKIINDYHALAGDASGLRNRLLKMMPGASIATAMYFIMCRYYLANSANISEEVFTETEVI